MVVVALAPFGPALSIPADLPVEAAIVAIVKSLSGTPMPAQTAAAAPARGSALPTGNAPPLAPSRREAEPLSEPLAVPRHIRSLMEEASSDTDEEPVGDAGRTDDRGQRRRRRRGRGGRGRHED